MNIKFCSGLGRYHTDNPDSPKTKPFNGIAYNEIVAMAINPLTVPKQDAPWFIPSTLLTRSKSVQVEQGQFYCLALDIDHNPPVLTRLAEIMLACWRGDFGFLIYTSRSATESCQKSHILIPTTQLTGYRWMLAQIVLNDALQKSGITPDRKTEDANQIIYLPNRGEYYAYIHHPSPALNPLLSCYDEMLKKHKLIEAKKQARNKARTTHPTRPKHQGNSLIAEFNATYSVEELLIQAGYDQKGTHFRHPNSKTGNHSASVKNGKVFTLSSADPLYSKYAQDAFNVFVILLNEGDRKAAMLNAGNHWLSVEGMSWNKYQQRAYRERKQ